MKFRWHIRLALLAGCLTSATSGAVMVNASSPAELPVGDLGAQAALGPVSVSLQPEPAAGWLTKLPTPDAEAAPWNGAAGPAAPAVLPAADERTHWFREAGWTLLVGLTVAGATRLVGRQARKLGGQAEGLLVERAGRLMRLNAELARLHRAECVEKTAALRAEEKARLTALRHQLDPHFLFNVLTSISASLPAGEGATRGMVERLAEFYRLTLRRSEGDEWTTLGEEIELLQTYFEIERSRWGDLLDVHVACEPGLEGERLPHFLLLPPVENALKYGRATSADQIGVRLIARREAGSIFIEVANTGEWVEPAAATRRLPSLGIGLDNVRQRLARCYPQGHDLGLSHADGWVAVSLRLAPLSVA